MTDVRRFDFLERTVADRGRQLDDLAATVLGRFGAHRPLPVVEYTSDIVYPFAEQVVLNTTDLMLYRYTGSAWEAFLALGGTTAATRHDARYHQTSVQAIANVTDVKLQMNVADTTSNDVTASGTGNQDFLVNRGGLWRLSASARLQATGADETHLFISTGTAVGTTANRVGGQTVSVEGSTAPSMAVCTDVRLAAGTSVFCGMYQNSGVSVNTDVAFGRSNHFAMTWLRP